MAPKAMGFSVSHHGIKPTLEINCMSYCFKMSRIYTQRNTTEMI